MTLTFEQINGNRALLQEIDQSFEEAWRRNGGSEQTQYFVEQFMKFGWEILSGVGGFHPPIESILDWGCAYGEATEFLERRMGCRVEGLDVSPSAIRSAKILHPVSTFYLSNFGEPRREYDMIYTSNCLEHFDQPLDLVRALLPYCKRYLSILVPFMESEPLCPSHRVSLGQDSFPEVLSGFVVRLFNVFESDPKYWHGKQMVIIYERIPEENRNELACAAEASEGGL